MTFWKYDAEKVERSVENGMALRVPAERARSYDGGDLQVLRLRWMPAMCGNAIVWCVVSSSPVATSGQHSEQNHKKRPKMAKKWPSKNSFLAISSLIINDFTWSSVIFQLGGLTSRIQCYYAAALLILTDLAFENQAGLIRSDWKGVFPRHEQAKCAKNRERGIS